VLFEERDEFQETDLRIVQFESQSVAHLDVLLDGLAQPAHRAPPGQGNASVRKEPRSTLA
jgi:hypothetical protein